MARSRTIPDSPIDNPDFGSLGGGFIGSLLLRVSVADIDRACKLMRSASWMLASFLVGGWIGLNANPGKVLSDELKRHADSKVDDIRRGPSLPALESTATGVAG